MISPAVLVSCACTVAAALGLVACDGGGRGDTEGVRAAAAGSAFPRGAERVRLDPAEFTTEIDNPYLPMTPGDRRVYRVTDPEGTRERAVAIVTGATRTTATGITARVVFTRVFEGDREIEDNHAWYAQDAEGNVWYLGELARELEDGKVTSTDGSWEAGVDGAEPGVVMPADPRVGLAYRQEHFAGVAEDRAEVFSLAERAEVPFGRFRDVVMTRETEGIERSLLDYKFYARGVGPVLGVEISAGSGREELVRFVPGGPN
jgi:hypothetical protein